MGAGARRQGAAGIVQGADLRQQVGEVAVDDGGRRDGAGLVAEVPVGQDPYGAALTPDGKFVYSGNLKDNSLSVIDTGSLKVVATVTGLNEPRQAIAFSADNAHAYVLNRDLSVAVVDRAKNAVVSTMKP